MGLAGGGTKSNVIPAEAWAEVDVRIARKADAAAHRAPVRRPQDPRLALFAGADAAASTGRRWSALAARWRCLNRARALAAELGFALDEASTGGASDGNFTSALGIPTLDGMGAVGEGAHARHESILLEHLAPRTALLAGMLRTGNRGFV